MTGANLKSIDINVEDSIIGEFKNFSVGANLKYSMSSSMDCFGCPSSAAYLYAHEMISFVLDIAQQLSAVPLNKIALFRYFCDSLDNT